MLYLTTSFSPSMLDPETDSWDLEMDQISSEEARAFLFQKRPDIRIANEMLARLISEALDLPFTPPTSRSKITFYPGDEVLIASYSGPKLNPAAPLPETHTLSFWKAVANAAN